MTTQPIEIFYSYAHEDEDLQKQLDEHLSSLKQQKLISGWYDRDISAGALWSEEIQRHLHSARIILFLVSSSFLASKYCYEVEVQEALKRHEAGEAVVIPVILRSCYWQVAPFGQFQALPKNAKPVTLWSNRDAAFTDVVKGIVKVINEIDSQKKTLPTQQNGKRKRRMGEVLEEEYESTAAMPEIPHTPTAFNNTLKKAIERYYKELKEYEGKADYELALRSAFQNLLAEACRLVKWTLIPEQTLEGGIRPDGVVRDAFELRRGYWEAKGPKSDLDKEIAKKIADNYPLMNTLFENTRVAVLYQSKKRLPYEYDLTKPNDVSDLIKQFVTYTEPDIANFETAVGEFKQRIPELAKALLDSIEKEQKQNKKFITAFDTFTELCRTSLDPKISDNTIKEMLVQHLLTERLFRTIFGNADFVNRNVIAAEIERVIQALTSRSFDRQEFLKSLDRFYVAIESAAKGIESWSERQHFLNTVYERFFQGFSVKQADTLGIVYTPQEIVDFMCASVEEVLQREFGTSIAEPGVQILDPATGTGSFIVNLLHRIPRHQLKHKYRHDLFCNEVTLLPYYIASLNIEHEYFERVGEYEPFEGICFADTLELAEGQQLPLFVEENTERVQREKDAQIMVVIGNPPYNVGQKSENDNNKNRKYPLTDARVSETYAKDSKASNKIALSDVYVKFFRWASDRLGNRDGVVCMITNNSFIDQVAFDGMRMHLQKDFTTIYHIDLHGNVRKNPKISGTTHNVFGIQVGVGVTIAVRNAKQLKKVIYYNRVPDFWRKAEKLAFLKEKGNISAIEWLELQPNERHIWMTEGLRPEFSTYFPMGSKEARLVKSGTIAESNVKTIFKTYSLGPRTNRDDWVRDFNREALTRKVFRLVDTYNGEVDRWHRRGSNNTGVDDFVIYDDKRIKWSRDLKLDLQRGSYSQYNEEKIRRSLYRPFCKQYLFFDRVLNEEVYQFPQILPTSTTEQENIFIGLTDLGSEKPFMVMASNLITDVHLVGAGCGTQCFPFYTYSEDGSNRRENITNWALNQFQARYGNQVTKWDIFHYVYSLLHHSQYRERYVENLKRDLPHIPLVHTPETFQSVVNIGKQLMDIHLNYETAKEYRLTWLENENVPFSWRVEKMRLSTDKRVVVVNESLRLGPLPQECFDYRLGNRSALEWVIDQYQVSKDSRNGIESDPNRLDNEEYIVRLVCKVVQVSVETVQLVNELAQKVTVEDWTEESVNVSEATEV
ncbi:TIR domain-containing protein [Ktedonobacteria bacterium brp13]|nr:TIR domain-containing protein [Ktedonobacteria bacterium brp13]